MRRARRLMLVLVAASAYTTARAADPAPPPAPDGARPGRVLPGVRADGMVQLPNQWRLKPAGTQLEVGSFPMTLAAHPGGRYLAVLHAGYGDHEVMILDLAQKLAVVGRTRLPQAFYGVCFSPDGKTLFASGGETEVVHQFAFADGLLADPRKIAIAGVTAADKFIVGGVAVDAAGKNLYAAGTWGDAVARIPLGDPAAKQVRVGLGGDPADPATHGYPYAVLPEPGGKRVFVSLWNKAAVAVIDAATDAVVATWPTESHPTEMALSPDGKHLYVACSNSTSVTVVDVAAGRPVQTIRCALYPKAPSGNTPNSLCLTPDGALLFVANADANNVAVFNVENPLEAKPLGFVPVGWYPTSVRFDPAAKKLVVANGKGAISRANRNGPQPAGGRDRTTSEYIATLFKGTLSVIDLPTPAAMVAHSKAAYECSPLPADPLVAGGVPAGNPVPRKVGDPSPITHVVYIIKENRTYDQVLGDVTAGNGDPDLCLFPKAVTPNHHKLAAEFVLLDNLYVDGEVSPDGHEWSMAAYATDYVEKVWPLVYRGGAKKLTYPAEGSADHIARPAGGYVWDRCAEAGVTYRSYGEWVENAPQAGQPGKALVKAIDGHFDPLFRSYDTGYPDVKRADRFISEVRRFEREGAMPRLQIVRLPNDHTAGTRVGGLTPTAMVADNDLALGRVVDALSRSKFWPTTAVFVIEDDAQNGPDHVDAHRTVGFVLSPYARRAAVDSTMYSTTSLLRTIELILGLKPMSQFDAAATPMFACFGPTPDLTPYTHEVPAADLNQRNKKDAYGAKLSEAFDLTKEDAADDLAFNEVIWRSVKGPKSAMPGPVRAAFFRAHGK